MEICECYHKLIKVLDKPERKDKIPTLTAELLHIFIKRVEAGEREENYALVAANLRIYYRDIGLADELPQAMTEAVAGEVA